MEETDFSQDGCRRCLLDCRDCLQEFKCAVKIGLADLFHYSGFQLLDRLFQKGHVLQTVFDQEPMYVRETMPLQGFNQLRDFRFAGPRANCAMSSPAAFPSSRASRIA
jgi:hypothetical protein